MPGCLSTFLYPTCEVSGMKSKGFIRLAIVMMSILIIGFLIPSLKIYHFSPFNSGVSSVIAVVALAWIFYSIVIWVADGFRGQ
jgi:hypothetical protein